MELTVRYLPVGDLRPAKRNARTHSDDQVAQLVGSIQEFGWTNPILIDENGEIIAGHGRFAAAEALGMETVPTICIAGLSAAKKRALALADNKLALNAGWDEEILRIELADLQAADDVDLPVIGFSEAELERLLGGGSADTGAQLGDMQFRVVVLCAGETEQAALIARLEGEGYSCQPLMS